MNDQDQELNLGHLAEEFAKLLIDVPQAAAASDAAVSLEEGERREVTTLFLDLVGYTRLAERLDPEQLKFVVSNTLQVFTNQVKKFGGTVEKFVGDAIMALFGRTQAHEDDSRRAVASAKAILDRLEDVNSILSQRGIKLHARMGINRGLIVTGKLAEHETVTGEAINIAQRLEANAPEDGILIDESVYSDCKLYYRCEQLPPLMVKNKTEPLTVYRVWEELPAPKPTQHSGAGPFVGRDGELAALHTVWERVVAGHSSVIQITGEAGMGKSRLAQEFVSHLHGRTLSTKDAGHPAVMYITAESFGQPPYHILSDIVREYLEQAKVDLDAFLADAADDSLRSGVQGYQLHLRDLMGLPLGSDEQASLEVMEPRARQAEMLLALKRFILCAAQLESKRNVPALVIVIDNQQWVSHASRDTLGQILQTLPENLPILWLFVGRPMEVGRWFPANLSVTTLNLTSLTSEAVEEFIRLKFPSNAVSPEFRRQLIEKTGGNPFYVSEVLAVMEQAREESGVSLEEYVPSSVKALILSRLDRLARPRKFALQVAAIAGREFSLALLGHIVERVRYPFDASQLVDELIGAELLTPTEGTYSIAQPMVAEVAYSTILHANRRKLHGLVAQWVEDCHKENMRPYAAYLAEQWGRAGEMEKAITNYLEAGFSARARYAYRDGVIFFEHALQLIGQAKSVYEPSEGEISDTGGEEEETMIPGVPSGAQSRKTGVTSERLGLIYVALSHFYEALGNTDGRGKVIREGIAAIPPTEWSVAALRWQAAYLQFERGDRAGAEQAVKGLANDPVIKRFPDLEIECHILLGALAWERGEDADPHIESTLALRGEVEKRLAQYDESKSLDRYRAAFDQSIIYKVDYNVFNHYKNINDLTKAEEYFYKVLEPTGAKHAFAQHMVHLFYCSLMWDRGVEFPAMAMRAALAKAYFREIGWARGVGWGGFYRGAALWRLGQFAEAHQVITETLQYLEKVNDKFINDKLELLLAAVFLARGDEVGYQLRRGRILSGTENLPDDARLAMKREFSIFEGQCCLDRHRLAKIYEELMEVSSAPLAKVESDEYFATVALVAAQLGHAPEAAKRMNEIRPSIEKNRRTWLLGLASRIDGILAAGKRDADGAQRAFRMSLARFQEVGSQFEMHLTYKHWWRTLEQLGLTDAPAAAEVKRGMSQWESAQRAPRA